MKVIEQEVENRFRRYLLVRESFRNCLAAIQRHAELMTFDEDVVGLIKIIKSEKEFDDLLFDREQLSDLRRSKRWRRIY